VTQAQQRQLFAGYWRTVLDREGANPAIYAGDGSVLRSFQDLEAERSVWREKLAPFSSGNCLVCILGNDPSFPALVLASWDKGLVIAPGEADLPDSQLRDILALTGAHALVRANRIEHLKSPPIAWTYPAPDMLKITSGTTGTPRTIRVRESHLVADCRNICSTMGILPSDVNFGAIPFSHSYGFSNLITPLLLQGTRLVCTTDRMPRAMFESIERSKATIFPGTPALFQAFASLQEVSKLASVRLCISAGAPLATNILHQFHEKFGLKIHSFYGSSECGGIAYDRSDWIDLPGGYVGNPLDGVKVAPAPNDRITVEGENVADGYYPHPDDEILDGKRFTPGDVIVRSDAGMLLIGRVTDVVNVAGKKVHPSVVEEHLRKLPGVVDVVVFGIPSATRNEDLVAYVTCSTTLSRRELENHCRNGLSSWQVPREFQIWPELPVNVRGKISRSDLARLHVQRTG
jgi:long-chain acyl-CoA synthetase